MSAWKEWQIALKNGDTERAEEARREYESECRAEANYDRYCDERDSYSRDDIYEGEEE